MFRGRFVFPSLNLVSENVLLADGQKMVVRQAYRGDTLAGPPASTFWVGLTRVVDQPNVGWTEVLQGEPTVQNGYARLMLQQNDTGFPTELNVNNVYGLRSLELSWIANGGDFDKPITRPFLCGVSSGSSGGLYALGAPLAQEITVVDQQKLDIFYEVYVY